MSPREGNAPPPSLVDGALVLEVAGLVVSMRAQGATATHVRTSAREVPELVERTVEATLEDARGRVTGTLRVVTRTVAGAGTLLFAEARNAGDTRRRFALDVRAPADGRSASVEGIVHRGGWVLARTPRAGNVSTAVPGSRSALDRLARLSAAVSGPLGLLERLALVAPRLAWRGAPVPELAAKVHMRVQAWIARRIVRLLAPEDEVIVVRLDGAGDEQPRVVVADQPRVSRRVEPGRRERGWARDPVFQVGGTGGFLEYAFTVDPGADGTVWLATGTGAGFLELDDPVVRRGVATFASLKGFRNVHVEGTYRPHDTSMPVRARNLFYNTIATQTEELLDTFRLTGSRFARLFSAHATRCLLDAQEDDGTWRASHAFLRIRFRYGVGPRFVDTRIHTEAAHFLARYHALVGSPSARDAALRYAEVIHRQVARGHVWPQGDDGLLLADVFFEGSDVRSHVSLNHHLCQLNFLTDLEALAPEARRAALVERLRRGVEETSDRWVMPSDDLYYGLYPVGGGALEARPTDYPDVTYRDLIWAQDAAEERDGRRRPRLTALTDAKARFNRASPAPLLDYVASTPEILERMAEERSARGQTFLLRLRARFTYDPQRLQAFGIGRRIYVSGARSLVPAGGAAALPLDPDHAYSCFEVGELTVVACGWLGSALIDAEDRLDLVVDPGRMPRDVCVTGSSAPARVVLRDRGLGVVLEGALHRPPDPSSLSQGGTLR